jgi:hypothetical protein
MDTQLKERGTWHRPAPRPLYRELPHVLRRRQGLLGVEALLLLARAEGLSDKEILGLVRSWEGRRWPPR